MKIDQIVICAVAMVCLSTINPLFATEEKTENDNGKSEHIHRSSDANRPIDPRAFDQSLLSGLVFDLTNAERRRAGLPEFKSNRYLSAAAMGHSRDMASRNYFNHKSKGIFRRTSPRDRIEGTGYTPSMSAENIAMIPTFNSQMIQSYPGYGRQVVQMDSNSYNRLAIYAVQQWMESPGHRRNILNGNLTELGIGVAIGVKDNIPYVYLTQNFGGGNITGIE